MTIALPHAAQITEANGVCERCDFLLVKEEGADWRHHTDCEDCYLHGERCIEHDAPCAAPTPRRCYDDYRDWHERYDSIVRSFGQPYCDSCLSYHYGD